MSGGAEVDDWQPLPISDRQLRSQTKAAIQREHLNCLADQPRGTGLIYDERMLAHECLWDPNFPENPDRAKCIWERCLQYRLVDRCVRIEARASTQEELLSVHGPSYIQQLADSPQYSLDMLKQVSSTYDAVYLNSCSYEALSLAAGSSVELVEQILQGRIRNGFAIVRPPGHHAMEEAACGYCLVNNVAVAARHALDHLGLDRILIIDVDVHHGQATQFAFYDDPRVLYFSIHRYEFGQFWPNLRESDYDYIGSGSGKGFNINVPFNQVGMTDADYLSIFQQILLPVAYEFRPELVLVSCGYDCLLGDPEGESKVTPACYPHMLHLLQPLAQGRLAVVLEGGYCLEAMAEAGALTLRELLGDPVPSLLQLDAPLQSTVESILHVIRVLRPFWNCLAYQGTAKTADELPKFMKDIVVPKQNLAMSSSAMDCEVVPTDEDLKNRGDFLYSIHKHLQDIKLNTTLSSPCFSTCMVYDEAMNEHRDFLQSHPERPSRITEIRARLEKCGLLDRMLPVKSREATEEEILTVHTAPYLLEAQNWENKPEEDLYVLKYNSVYVRQTTYRAARLCAGSVLNVVDSVVSQQAANGIAVVRPPGHHAEPNRCMGFCIFNQVGIAAKYAQSKHGIKRILILDWDVHHGNGTQAMFHDDKSVLFISLHRFDKGGFYPHHGDSNYNFIGTGEGVGYNVNIAWCGKGRPFGDSEYIAAFQQVVMPIAYEFNPELVLVSAGFDAAQGDPLGGYAVSPEGFGHMTKMLTSLAMGRVILVLEGGYNNSATSKSMSMCASVLLGDLCPPLPENVVPCKAAVKTLKLVINQLSPYWKLLQYKVNLPSTEDTLEWLADQHGWKKHKQRNQAVEQVAGEMQNLDLEGHEGQQGSEVKEENQVKDNIDRENPESSKVLSSDEASQSEADPRFMYISFSQLSKGGAKSKPPKRLGKPGGRATGGKDSLKAEPSDVSEQPGLCAAGHGPARHDEEATDADHPDQGEQGGEQPSGGGGDEQGAVGGAGGGAGNAPEGVRDFLGAEVRGVEGEVRMYSVRPLTWCPHLPQVQPVPAAGLNVNQPCGVDDCRHVGENWVCLICYEVYCSRYINEHMLFHGIEREHPLVLSYADLSVWCYSCDSYVHNEILIPAKRAAHQSKFGLDIPGQHH